MFRKDTSLVEIIPRRESFREKVALVLEGCQERVPSNGIAAAPEAAQAP